MRTKRKDFSMLFTSRSRVVSDFCTYSLWHSVSEGRASNAVSGRTVEAWLHIVHIPVYCVLLHLLVTPLFSCIRLENLQVLHALLTPTWSPNPASSHSCPHDLSVRYSWLPVEQPVSSMSMCMRQMFSGLTYACADMLGEGYRPADWQSRNEWCLLPPWVSLWRINFGFFSLSDHWFSEAL